MSMLKKFSILLILSNFCYSQDTSSFKDILEVEQELAQDKETAFTVLSFGIAIHILAIHEGYVYSKSMMTYGIIGIFLEAIGVIQLLKIHKREKILNELYEKRAL